MAVQEPGEFSGKQYSAEDLAMLWAVPVATTRTWIRTGLIERDRQGAVRRSQLLRFVNSAGGQAAIAATRNAAQ